MIYFEVKFESFDNKFQYLRLFKYSLFHTLIRMNKNGLKLNSEFDQMMAQVPVEKFFFFFLQSRLNATSQCTSQTSQCTSCDESCLIYDTIRIS
jgi:hypothetical protein